MVCKQHLMNSPEPPSLPIYRCGTMKMLAKWLLLELQYVQKQECQNYIKIIKRTRGQIYVKVHQENQTQSSCPNSQTQYLRGARDRKMRWEARRCVETRNLSQIQIIGNRAQGSCHQQRLETPGSGRLDKFSWTKWYCQ